MYRKTALERDARERRSPENEKGEKIYQTYYIQDKYMIPSGRRPGPPQARPKPGAARSRVPLDGAALYPLTEPFDLGRLRAQHTANERRRSGAEVVAQNKHDVSRETSKRAHFAYNN